MLFTRIQHRKNHGSHLLASLTKQTPSSQFQEIKNQATNMALKIKLHLHDYVK
jgi:hypothetical protein